METSTMKNSIDPSTVRTGFEANLKDLLPHYSEYDTQQKFDSDKWIIEKEDWTDEEWQVILKLFGMIQADRFEINHATVKQFGIAQEAISAMKCIRSFILYNEPAPKGKDEYLTKLSNLLGKKQQELLQMETDTGIPVWDIQANSIKTGEQVLQYRKQVFQDALQAGLFRYAEECAAYIKRPVNAKRYIAASKHDGWTTVYAVSEENARELFEAHRQEITNCNVCDYIASIDEFIKENRTGDERGVIDIWNRGSCRT